MRTEDRIEGENFWKDGFDGCPDCDGDYFVLGPRGASSRNIMCPKCESRFNILGPFGIERIGLPKSVAPREYPSQVDSRTQRLCNSNKGGVTTDSLSAGDNRHRGATKRKKISPPKSPPGGELADCDPGSKN